MSTEAPEIAERAVLENAPGSSILGAPSVVVAIDLSNDEIWLSELQRPDAKRSGRMRSYFRAPRWFRYSELRAQLGDFKLTRSRAEFRPLLNEPDEQILASAESKRERKQYQKMLQDRDARWKALLPILAGDKNPKKARRPLEILTDKSLPERMKVRAAQLGQALSTLYCLLNQYFAMGCRKNSLCTMLFRCGCPGKNKQSTTKQGRESRLYKKGEAGPGFVMTEEDAKRLAWGYTLIDDKTTAKDAFHLTSGVFWGDRSTNDEGKTVSNLWPADQRPTHEQFMYWGRKLNKNKSVRRLIMGEARWSQKTSTRGGSLQDQVNAVAQLAYFDGTSTDVYLASIQSRLKKLPPMTRLLLKEARSEIVYGLFCGWEPPSSTTALMTVLHGCEDKVEYCRRYGITITAEDWPSFLALTAQADHGELKGERITEAEEQFGFAVEYVQVRRGDKKGGIEAQNKSDHVRLDHRLPGTTHGKRRERGEEHPACDALWNYNEYMRELIEAILEHNNGEALELAPLEMLRQKPELRPTRLNIFKWLRAKGLTAELPYDVDVIRAFMLPDRQAVIRKNGVYLMEEIHGRLQVIPKLRYVSEALLATGVLTRVKLTGNPERVRIKLHESRLDVAWMPSKTGMIQLQLQSKDSLLRERATLKDWCTWLEDLTIERDRRKGGDQQSHLSKLLRRQQTTADAKAQQKNEIAALPKPPSKAEQKRDLKENRDQEKVLLGHRPADAEDSQRGPLQRIPDAASPPISLTASARAMQRFRDSAAQTPGH